MRARTRALAASLLLAGCSEQSFHEIAPPNLVGDLALTGRVCDAQTRSWLEGAAVYTHLVNEDGVLTQTYEAYSDAEGYWTLEGLAVEQTYTIYVQHGSEVLDLFDVTMPETDVVLEEPDCSSSADVSVAVITGDYDELDEVLGKVGISGYDLVNGTTGAELVQFLSSLDNLTPYDALFFPGGHLEEDVVYDSDGDSAEAVAAVQQALQAYVAAGGMVYASDWSYDVIESIWPGRVDFLGDDALPDDAQKGEAATVTARITDGALESAVGASSVEITFDLDGWPVIKEASANATVYMTADVPWRQGMDAHTMADAPILIGFKDEAGDVIFSSWRQNINADGDALAVIRHMLSGL